MTPGSGDGPGDVRRRQFLQAGALATATTLTQPIGGIAAAPDDAAKSPLPTRTLGKTGVKVSILNLGTWRNPGLDRLLRFAYANGVRYFDAARSYGSEPAIKKWFQQMPEVRKEIFLVTKDDRVRSPSDLPKRLDERLKALGTDHLDLFFIHALGDADIDAGLTWPKSPELGRTIEAIKKSGKAKYVGFSTHHPRRAEILQAAAEGGFVDAIMLQYTPWLDRDAPLNRALDACHAKGIGLISMKQVAGQGGGQPDVLSEVVKRVPMLKEKGLSPYQGLLHAIWTDERISSSCVSMRNVDQIRENAAAARSFKPLEQAQIDQLRDAMLAAGPTLCADCDGRCARAAGTVAPLGDLTRFLTYYKHHGNRADARRYFAELAPEARAWHGADLDAARAACPNRLDFAALLPEVDRLLS